MIWDNDSDVHKKQDNYKHDYMQPLLFHMQASMLAVMHAGTCVHRLSKYTLWLGIGVIVLPEHGFLLAGFHGCVDMNEEAWEARRKVLNKLIRHSTQRCFHLVWKLTVVVFLAHTERKELTLERNRVGGIHPMDIYIYIHSVLVYADSDFDCWFWFLVSW